MKKSLAVAVIPSTALFSFCSRWRFAAIPIIWQRTTNNYLNHLEFNSMLKKFGIGLLNIGLYNSRVRAPSHHMLAAAASFHP